jgi:hypothetical protein
MPRITHRLIRMINQAFDSKQYCSAAFLDIIQAFDKVWHITYILIQVKNTSPPELFYQFKFLLPS